MNRGERERERERVLSLHFISLLTLTAATAEKGCCSGERSSKGRTAGQTDFKGQSRIYLSSRYT